MAVFKCKMCGGSLEVTEGMTVCECEYCGTQQTLPKTDNEQNLNMFNRANHFRQQCEFDKAAEIYEKMAARSDGDAELYWSIVLCRYGIEYVDDPLTKKKIATCHRTQFKSILNDPDYLSALEHADTMQRSVYEREAAYIDKVQKGILEISNKEKPFDVFICYKETDENGRRTQDSVLAQELYYGLTNEGFKVFFSRITLESKLGTEYEPYIFAALNSAKVMVVVGTKPEYFNAVWVRNEWSRYLMLMQEDRSRTLIPAYKDMDPYDLPDALSMFQAQDMSKLGFMQDLIHGIRKLAKVVEPEKKQVQQTIVSSGNNNVAPLLKRISLFLEDGDWTSAKDYCEKVLDQDPENAQAYFSKFLAANGLHTEQEFEEFCKLLFTDCEGKVTDLLIYNSDIYKKAIRFANDAQQQKLNGFIESTTFLIAEKHMQLALMSEKEIRQYLNDWFKAIVDNAKKRKLSQQNIQSITQSGEKIIEEEFRLGVRPEMHLKTAHILLDSIPNYPNMKSAVEKCKKLMQQTLVDKIDHSNSAAQCDSALNICEAFESYIPLDDIKALSAQKAEEFRRKDAIYNRGIALCKSEKLEDQQEGLAVLGEIADYLDAGAFISRMKVRVTRDLRRRAYEQKYSEISEEKKALYEESAHLGIFSGKRKSEIAYLLQELSKKEQALNTEYSDILR